MRVFILYLAHYIKKNMFLSFCRVETCFIFEKSLISLGSLPRAYFPGLILKLLGLYSPYLDKWSYCLGVTRALTRL